LKIEYRYFKYITVKYVPIIKLFYTLSLIWLYREMLRIQTKNEMFEITRPEMMDELLFAVGMVMKKVSV